MIYKIIYVLGDVKLNRVEEVATETDTLAPTIKSLQQIGHKILAVIYSNEPF